MMLHEDHASHHGHHIILIRTDTYVEVLTVSVSQDLGP